MKCVNFDCDNNLTDFEIKKIKNNRKSKHRFCIKCRIHINKIQFIKCVECGDKISNMGLKILCEKCRKEHKRQKYDKENLKRKEYYKIYQREYRRKHKQILTTIS